MTATNHALTGALIGATVSSPVVALPLAFLSHFALDVLPHFGEEKHTTKFFLSVLGLDFILGVGLLVWLVTGGFMNTLIIVACGMVAVSPDFLWAPMWISEMKGRTYKLKGLMYWLKKIQWGEFSRGLAVEIPFGIVVFGLLLGRLA